MSLGKGLGALIASNNRKIFKKGQLHGESNLVDGKIWQIPLESINSDSNQPRKNFDAQSLQELADSIKVHGVLQPILVSEKTDGGYEIISGERRWRAAKIAGLVQIPALVKELPRQQRLEVALIENIQRQDLNPLEEAFAYQRLLDEFNLTQQQVAEKVGKARSTVANMVRILHLPVPVKEALAGNKINFGHAKVLLSLESADLQLEMLSSMLGEKISVRELERRVMPKKKFGIQVNDPNITYLEDQLQTVLGAKVSISHKNGRGKIVIDFYSSEELSNLVDRLNG